MFTGVSAVSSVVVAIERRSLNAIWPQSVENRDRILGWSLREIHRVEILSTEELWLTRAKLGCEALGEFEGKRDGTTPRVAARGKLGPVLFAQGERRHIRFLRPSFSSGPLGGRIFKHFWPGIPSPSASPALSNSSGPMGARGIVFSRSG